MQYSYWPLSSSQILRDALTNTREVTKTFELAVFLVISCGTIEQDFKAKYHFMSTRTNSLYDCMRVRISCAAISDIANVLMKTITHGSTWKTQKQKTKTKFVYSQLRARFAQ